MKLNIDDYIGKKINSLVVVGKDTSNKHYNANRWIFRCDCGKEFSDCPCRVLSGHKKSCGCQKGKASLVHGCNGDEFYPTWWGMMRRCYNKSSHNYDRYGGRGITVCEEWHNPIVFIEWARKTIGHKIPGYTLDRKDNNLGYSPENCQWVSAKSQARNRRSNRLETINGETKTLSEWCELYGIRNETVHQREKRGIPFLEALTTPVRSKAKHT